MNAGVIAETLAVIDPGLGGRSSNRDAQLFILGASRTIDVGYVAKEKQVQVWLWNGSVADTELLGETTESAEGISYADLNVGDSIPALSSELVTFTVSQYGLAIFSSVFTFDFDCTLDVSITLTGTRPIYATDQPTPITLNEAMAEAYADQSSGETYFDTMEFIELSSGDSVKVVHSDEDLETPQGTFIACKFGCKHPETEGGIVGSMQITVDFLPLAAQRWIAEKSRTGTGVIVYWRQYLGPNIEPDAYYPLPLDITSVEQSWTGATITASFPLLTAMKFPRRLMTTTVLPGGIT